MATKADILVIENRDLRVALLPGYGARVTTLLDKRIGRDWLAKGGTSDDVGGDAAYAIAQAVGWDECFPTVAPWDASATGWGRRLRDHGDLWGRPWIVVAHSSDSVTTKYVEAGFQFMRTLSLSGAILTADYRVHNTGSSTLPFIWSQHALLATIPGETIDGLLPHRLSATFLSVRGRTLSDSERNVFTLPFALERVQSVTTQFAGKFYAPQVDRVSVRGPAGGLELTWSGIEHLGIWLAYGGWPVPGNLHHVSFEPTTSPTDHLGAALEDGSALTLFPGDAVSWQVTMTVRPYD